MKPQIASLCSGGSIAGDHRTLSSLFSAQTKCFTSQQPALPTKLPTAGERGAEHQQYRNYLNWNLTVMFLELVLRRSHRLSPGSAPISRVIFTQQSTNTAVGGTLVDSNILSEIIWKEKNNNLSCLWYGNILSNSQCWASLPSDTEYNSVFLLASAIWRYDDPRRLFAAEREAAMATWPMHSGPNNRYSTTALQHGLEPI